MWNFHRIKCLHRARHNFTIRKMVVNFIIHFHIHKRNALHMHIESQVNMKTNYATMLRVANLMIMPWHAIAFIS